MSVHLLHLAASVDVASVILAFCILAAFVIRRRSK